ncbi:hypothetical protein ACFOKF_16420 [Sphingobium rhizovicinum]|uniref:Uncharacterized protein n=1 Tax=Sphingobium rhizovicinum TaxID=432308 RepID=A0ABV7NGZ8_9SPHN
MAFAFKRWDNLDVGTEVFELPSMPFGTDFRLMSLIRDYTNAITEDMESEHYKVVANEIAEFPASSISDIIAKMLIRLHVEHAGLDDTTLVFAPIGEDGLRRLMEAQPTLADLYRQLPKGWTEALGAVRAALLVERDYDRRVWGPANEVEKAGGARVPDAINGEAERLQDIRCNAEDYLIRMPAKTLAQFAIKYLIGFSWGRERGDHVDLCNEARRLLGVEIPDDMGELDLLLSNLNWSEG